MFRLRFSKINFYNLLYDLRDFIRCNSGKIIFMIIVHLVAVLLGIRGGLTVHNAEHYLHAHPSNLFLFMLAKRNILAYFAIELLTDIAILTLIALSSCYFLISYLSVVLLFLRTYLFVLYVCLYIIVLKLSVLPLLLFCIIPCFIVFTVIYTVVAVMAINRAIDRRMYGVSYCNCMHGFLRSMIIPCIMLVILSICCSVFVYFLTLGIIF